MSAEQQPNGAENQFNVHPGDVIFQAPAVVVDSDGYLDTADVDPAHLEAFVDAFGTSPGVLAVGLLDADRLELDAAGASASPEVLAPATRFGARGQFMLISTAEEAPSVDEQVAQFVGHVDPSMLRGLRLFHSYVLLNAADVRGWLDSGIAGLQAATAEDVFTDRPAETWRHIMKNSPFPKNLFATWASHPERN